MDTHTNTIVFLDTLTRFFYLSAPITCNSMGKAVAGIGDNLLSSVFVAWEYQKKRMIFCPACNVSPYFFRVSFSSL